jgi:hypothetical protein
MTTLFREEWSLAREGANNALTEVHFGDFQEISLSLNRARAGIDGAYERLQHAEALVGHIQNQLGLEHRWEIGGEEYSRFKEEAMISKYRIALNELERLVVMRLFELSKLGLSGTGMILMCVRQPVYNLYQVINFVSKSTKPYSDVPKQSVRLLPATTCKRLHSIPPARRFLGRKLLIIAFWVNSTSSVSHVLIFVVMIGPNLSIEKLQ